ncbi:MAG TPA: DUF6178 family protein, partial [Polyangiaceae bacterium]|nr:DUF6178 family protein [Polyangiaceae bacterium]
RAGDDEEFDAARFVTWLEVLQEAGDAFAAARVTELSLDFVTLAFNELLLVLNVDSMIQELDGGGEEVDGIEKALSNCAYEELDEFQLIARRADGWDAVWSLVLALDRDHRDFLRRVLERCCRASHAYIEENGGLQDVLSDEEMFESDARAERDDRRAAKGHVAASDAKSFLGLAASGAEPRERDAVTRAYFRELEPSVAAPKGSVDRRRSGARIERLLAALEVDESTARAPRLAGASEEARLPLSVALDELSEGALVARYREELAYLANVLIAGAALEERRFRPIEALEAAIAVTNLGMELAMDSTRLSAVEVLSATSADVLFRQGFAVLRRDVVAPARANRASSSLGEDVPRLPDAGGLGFVATREQLARATRLAVPKESATKQTAPKQTATKQPSSKQPSSKKEPATKQRATKQRSSTKRAREGLEPVK